MVTTTPKLRADLHSAEVVESDGVLYYDVSDPVTGGVLRLFDYEWLIAQRLDGQRNLDDVARWTAEHFGFAASRDDIAVYAERLIQLGLVEGQVAAGTKPIPAVLFISTALKSVGMLAGSIKVAGATATPAVTAPPAVTPVAVTPVQKATSKPPLAATSRPADKQPEPADRRPGRDEDAMMGPALIPQRQPAQPLAHPQRLTPAITPQAQPIAPAPVVTPPVEAEPPSLPQAPLARVKSDVLAAIESLPPPVDEPSADSQGPTGPIEQVSPPALGPEPTAPLVTPAVITPVVDLASGKTPTTTPAVKAPDASHIPIEQEPVVRPTEPSKPAEPSVAPAERPTVPLSESVSAAPPKPVVSTAPPTVRIASTPEEKPSSAGKWFVILIILAALCAAAYYFLAVHQPPPPAAVGVKISVVKNEDVARSFATAAVVKKAEPQPLKIDGDGTVIKVVADNTDVQQNTLLVQLDGQNKVTKELTDLKDRLNFYRKKLDSAKAKGKQELERDAQQKISEKQQRLEQVEAIIKKSQLFAPRAGAVSKALVKVGQTVTAGTDVISFADKALAAEIKIPAIEAQGMKVGQDVQLASHGGAVSARVATLRTEGEYAMVGFALPDDTTAKPGDELKLQKAPLSQVVRLPSTVLLEGSKVYVARDGKAAVVPVTVADREGDAVLVQGLPSGEQVIMSRPTELHEGVAIRPSTEP